MGDARQVQGLFHLAAVQRQFEHIVAVGNLVQFFTGKALQAQALGVVEYLDAGVDRVGPLGFDLGHGVRLGVMEQEQWAQSARKASCQREAGCVR